MGHSPKHRIKLWHDKAITRQKELNTLRKSLTYLTVSRDSWCEKARYYKAEAERLTRENRELKKKLQEG